MRDIIRAFKSLSDETRLSILNILLERECCVCEVMQSLDISQTRASRNLKLLYDAGFLSMKKEGVWVLYSIDRAGIKEGYQNLVTTVGELLAGNEIAVLDRKRLAGAERVGPGCVNRDAA